MKIICYSSNTAQWSFSFKEAVLAYELQKKGHEVLYVTSGNEFGKKSNPLHASILKKEFGLNGYDISSVLTPQDRKEIDALISGLNKENFENLVLDEVKIGKIALFEFLIGTKKIKIEFSDEEWVRALQDIKNALISFFACRHILEKEKPDLVYMFSTVYGVNHPWERYAYAKGVPVYLLENGLNFSDMDNTLIVAKNDWPHYLASLKKIWSEIKEISTPQAGLSYASEHFLELLKGRHYLVYSSAKSKEPVNIRQIFNIKDSQKIITATMCSYDEMFSGEYVDAWNKHGEILFPTQADWVKKVVAYVQDKSDLFLIIRIHPREFPNKRDGVKSEHAQMLEKILQNLPHNVKVNWPSDNLSMYDLAQVTDVFLNSWSSVGAEMTLLGIPVVLYSKELVGYPPDLNYVGDTERDYFAKIEKALVDGWDFDRIKYTYRWYALYYFRTIMRLKNIKIKDKPTPKPNAALAPVSKVRTLYNLLPNSIKQYLRNIKLEQTLGRQCREQKNEQVDISRLEKMLTHKDDTLVDVQDILTHHVSPEDENRFIRTEIKRLCHALYGSSSEKPKAGSLQDHLQNLIAQK